jgi:hypothetical protein
VPQLTAQKRGEAFAKDITGFFRKQLDIATPLIMPRFLGSAFFIFMMRQFFLGIPWELSDAARADGAGEWRIFWQIMLPLVRSALMVVAVFTFLWTWHEFFQPLIYLSERSQYPTSSGRTASAPGRSSPRPTRTGPGPTAYATWSSASRAAPARSSRPSTASTPSRS